MKDTQYLFAESDIKSPTGMSFFLVPQRYEYYPGDECIKLGEVEVTYLYPMKLSEEELRKKAIETLKDKQQRVMAEAFKRTQALEIKINQLLLLTDKSESINVVPIQTPSAVGDDIPF